jgi:manganese/zinc/iron transport system permease protein
VLHGQLETLLWWRGARHARRAAEVVDDRRGAEAGLGARGDGRARVRRSSGLLFKELRIAAFDPALATTQGFNATLLHYLLMVFVAAATVASFEAVGSILVIAMLVCPAATARLMTDRLAAQIVVERG